MYFVWRLYFQDLFSYIHKWDRLSPFIGDLGSGCAYKCLSSYNYLIRGGYITLGVKDWITISI